MLKNVNLPNSISLLLLSDINVELYVIVQL